MTPKETIDFMIAAYPSIVKNAWDCAKFLLFTNGNGFEWEKGEMVDYLCGYRKINDLSEALDHYFQYFNNKVDEKGSELIKVNIKTIEDSIKTITEHFSKTKNERYKINVNDSSKININDFNLIFCIPDDISNEWKQFCLEVLKTLIDKNKIPKEYLKELTDIYTYLKK